MRVEACPSPESVGPAAFARGRNTTRRIAGQASPLGVPDGPQQRIDEVRKSVQPGSHLVLVKTDVVNGLVERGMSVQILQLNEVHSRPVRETTERPPKIVMRDSHTEPGKPRAIGDTSQHDVRARLGEGDHS